MALAHWDAMTTLEVVMHSANAMDRDERWDLFRQCGRHDVQNLPRTSTGGEPAPHYCPNCLTLWSAPDAILNEPTPPDVSAA